MTRVRPFVFALALFAGGTVAVAGRLNPPWSALGQAPSHAFVGATVLPMDSAAPLPDHTVIVRADRILEVGPAETVAVPPGATRIDGRGKFLMPGLAEMHGHIPPPTAPADYVHSVLFLYVANGVTTVRGMLGAPNQLQLRERANRGEILAPTLYLAGPSFNGDSIESPEQAARRVREQKAEGWDLLKVHPGLTRAEYDAMARTAHQVGIPFAGHVPADVGLLRALEMNQATFDHLDGYIEYLEGNKRPVPEARLVEAAEQTKAVGAKVVPTMALWDTVIGASDLERLKSYPELRFMPPKQVQNWIAAYQKRLNDPSYDRAEVQQIARNRRRLLTVLSDRGVTILLGTDAPQMFSVPGFSIHREAREMADAGMTPYEIVRAGTTNVGEHFREKDTFGLVRAGHRADLMLLEANPLQDVGHLARRAGVMVRGRWLPEPDIQRRLAEIAAMHGSMAK